ncbi:NAD kinase 2, mitochondrial-like isoform X1 [Centruroides sculpturatus]|uniref:NAD kinase 2, mitochondrial-like isoform X1 n=1 Tax=Centruroides sculpturatus TaxID=218467 RepID=UPI000C6CAC51|nr:NAD kinase 2, mitochondrial-like isoform X1 [Centruroides sculpturatus]
MAMKFLSVSNVFVGRSSLKKLFSSVLSDMCLGKECKKMENMRQLTTKFYDNEEKPRFDRKNALILTKFSRYEFEKRRHPNLSEDELVQNLEERGSDYKTLLHHHEIHKRNQEIVADTLQKNGFQTKIVNRFEYNDDNIKWADVIFTTGGDGTFLMAASKIHTREKPVIGINSDPSRDSSLLSSLGYLCLPKKYTDDFPQAIEKLKSGNFKWKWRQRIRVTLISEHAKDPPIELHDQQLQYPEYRFLDCWQEQPPRKSEISDHQKVKVEHVLPVRALNEVFIGETLSSRVSYYELSVDNSLPSKQKSSGMTICTGTGSTSWSFNINKVTPRCVHQLLQIVNEETGSSLPVEDKNLVERIANKFNNSLIFDPSKLSMAYSIRDPVVFGVNFNSKPRGFAKKIEVKSRMFDACIVIDGGLSYIFNDGAVATLEIFEEDALRTVTLLD